MGAWGGVQGGRPRTRREAGTFGTDETLGAKSQAPSTAGCARAPPDAGLDPAARGRRCPESLALSRLRARGRPLGGAPSPRPGGGSCGRVGGPGWGTAEARVRAGPARGAWAPGPCRQRGTLRCAPPESRARRGSAHAHPEGRLLERPELNLRPEANQRPGAPTRPRTWPGQERLLFSIFCFYGCVQIYVYCTSCFMTLTPCFYSLYEKGVSRGVQMSFSLCSVLKIQK